MIKIRCPNCNKAHKKLPTSCVSDPDMKCSPGDMAKYLKDAGFWQEFCQEADGLRQALIDAGRRR